MAQEKKEKQGEAAKGPKTKIIGCGCDNEGQDRIYGRRMRLHNKTTSGYRCTVCASSK